MTHAFGPFQLRFKMAIVVCLSFGIWLQADLSLGASALGISAGLAGVEESDERYRPAVWLQAHLGPQWSLQLQTYGRIQKPVTQTTYLAAGTRNFPIFGSKYLLGRLGLALLSEITSISRSADSGRKGSETNNNVGLYLGLAWQSSSRLFITADWGSAVFPAGIAGIFLATARKQSLSLGIGWRLK